MLSAFRRLTLVQSNPILRASFSSTVPAFKEVKSSKKTKKPYKGRVTAFAFYNSQYYKSNANELKGIPLGEKSRIIAEAWRDLPDSEKAKFEELSDKDAARFQEEKSAYEGTKPPKRPVNGYMRYLQDVRHQILEENPTLAVTEVSSLGAKQWRALDPASKASYNDAYTKEMDEWLAKYGSKKN